MWPVNTIATRLRPSRVRRSVAPALLATVVWSVCLDSGTFVGAQGERVFKGRLSTVPAASALPGFGSLSAAVNGTKLSITGTFEGLSAPATIARLHRGAKGIRGPALADLKVSGSTSGAIAGEVELTPQQLSDLEQERLYVQLHSEKGQNGHLFGWLLPERSRQ
jgi:hypothetical protein